MSPRLGFQRYICVFQPRHLPGNYTASGYILSRYCIIPIPECSARSGFTVASAPASLDVSSGTTLSPLFYCPCTLLPRCHVAPPDQVAPVDLCLSPDISSKPDVISRHCFFQTLYCPAQLSCPATFAPASPDISSETTSSSIMYCPNIVLSRYSIVPILY